MCRHERDYLAWLAERGLRMTPRKYRLVLTDEQVGNALELAFKRMAEEMGLPARRAMERSKDNAIAKIRRALNECGTIQEFDV